MRFRSREDQLYHLDGLRLAVVAALLAVNYLVFYSPAASSVPDLSERLKVLKQTAPISVPDDGAFPVEDSPVAVLAGAFSRGDTILSVLQGAGVKARDAMPFVSALGTQFNFRKLKAGHHYRFELEDGQLRQIEIATSPLNVFVARASLQDDGPIEVLKKKVDTVRKIAQMGCVVTDNLHASVLRCGGNDKLARKLIDLLGPAIDFYADLRYGDEIRILVEKVFVGQELVDVGRILAVEYNGKVRHQAAYFYESPDGDWEYFDSKGESLARLFLRSPLKYKRISSGYDPKRFHPVLHTYKAHLAIDYAAPTGTPVWAYAGGVVDYMGRAGAAGNMVRIKHKDSYKTIYAHLNGYKKGLKRGDRVNQGDIIGYVGATGRATGPHLHFAVKRKGRYVNPFKQANPPLKKLAEEYQKHFDEIIGRYREQLDRIRIETLGIRRTS